ncbi:hypothetical protein JW968_02995 [Candidatus Woesearchaeota archaeon]|nr:hypothetical protein [Candidatus Woesearchaeota archaeon]
MDKYQVSGPILIIIGLVICVASAFLGLKFILFFIIGFFIFLNGVRKIIMRQKKVHRKQVMHQYHQVQIKYCIRCGFQMRKSDFYCPNCGIKN